MTRLNEPSERETSEIGPSLSLVGVASCLVDEWQEVPEVWDVASQCCRGGWPVNLDLADGLAYEAATSLRP